MIETKKHVFLNGKYLQDAKALLDKQDYVQASEKLWGAVAQIIKAIAINRGKRLRTLRQSMPILSNLRKN